jgi:protein-S-isoprenylcysteine O-methyltransferase Ste14
MSEIAPRLSTPHLFIDAVAQLAALFRTEIRLVRTELSEKAAKAVNAVAFIGGAVVLLLVALIILLQGAVAWLVAEGLAPHWAALAVGVPVALIGIGLLVAALNALKVKNLRPDRTLDQVNKDVAVVKEMVR